MPERDASAQRSRTPTASRRTVLRGAGALTVGVGALGLSSTSVSAGKGGCDDPPLSFPRVTTRDHFTTNWYGSVELTDDNDETNFEYDGDGIPGAHDSAPEEIVIHAHGWQNDFEGGVCTTHTTASTFDSEGYAHPVVGYTWDADFGWYNATEIAERNGAKLAYFAFSYDDWNPNVPIRLCGHSLGARVVLSTIKHLDEWGYHDVLESVTILAGAADDDAVSMEGEYGPSIERSVGRVDNFWMNGDAVLDWAYGTAEWGTAVGAAGCDGTPPANYTDHNVDYVDGHSDHYTEDGCIHEVLETF